MSNILKLTIINFSNLENNASDAISMENIYFESNEKGTAYNACGNYLAMQKVVPYLGHDMEIYPKFKVIPIHTRSVL